MTKVPTALYPDHSHSNSWSSSDSVVPPYLLAPSREVAGGEQPMKKKRNRKHNSCEPCRAKKVKCDRQVICANCRLHNKECFYSNAQPLAPSPAAQTKKDELAAAYAEITRLRLLVDQLTRPTTIAQPRPQLATPPAEYSFPSSSLALDYTPWTDTSLSSSSSGRSSFSSDLLTNSDTGYIPTSFPINLPPTSTTFSLFVSSPSVELGVKEEETIDLKGFNLGLEMTLEGVGTETGLLDQGGWNGADKETGEVGDGEWSPGNWAEASELISC